MRCDVDLGEMAAEMAIDMDAAARSIKSPRSVARIKPADAAQISRSITPRPGTRAGRSSIDVVPSMSTMKITGIRDGARVRSGPPRFFHDFSPAAR